MKRTIIFLFGASLISIVACNKAAQDIQPTGNTFSSAALARHGSDDTTGVDDHGGHGNDDSTNHQGNSGSSNNAEIIKSFSLPGSSSIKATKTDSMLVVLRSPAPAAGYTLTFTSSDPAVQPPTSLTMATGTTNRYVVLKSTAVKSARNVTITVTINGQSKSDNFKLQP